MSGWSPEPGHGGSRLPVPGSSPQAAAGHPVPVPRGGSAGEAASDATTVLPAPSRTRRSHQPWRVGEEAGDDTAWAPASSPGEPQAPDAAQAQSPQVPTSPEPDSSLPAPSATGAEALSGTAAQEHARTGRRGPHRGGRILAWVLGTGAVAAAVGAAFLRFPRTDVIMTTRLPVLVLEVGAALLGAALAVAVVRRRLRVAGERARCQAQQEAWEQHQQFLRRLDHELKNPLTAVRAAVADLPRTSPADLPARAEVVDTQARRMGRLVTDLRKLAELETAELVLEDVDLAEVVQDAVDTAVEEAASRSQVVRLRLDLPQVPWPLPRVRGDGDLLYSAVYNVVSNAAKYTPSGGTVEVRGHEEGGTVTIEVADTGIGVPEADMAVVWSELGRAGNVRGLPGSGLGLPLVATILRRHGGQVGMTSRQAVGTRVWLSLPVAGPSQG